MSNKQEGPDGHVSTSANINSETPNSNSTPTFIKEGISNVDIQNKLGKIEDDYATRQRIANKKRSTKSLQVQLRKSAIKKQRLRDREIKKKNKFNRVSSAEKAYFEQIHQKQWQDDALEESEVREFERLQQGVVRESEELQGKVRESEELHGVADQSGVNGPKLAEVNTTSQVRKKSKKKKVIRI